MALLTSMLAACDNQLNSMGGESIFKQEKEQKEVRNNNVWKKVNPSSELIEERSVQEKSPKIAIIKPEIVTANKEVTLILQLWNNEGIDIFGKRVKLLAENKKTEQKIELATSGSLGGAYKGADAHTLVTVMFPSSGIWQLEIYLDNKIFGETNVMVKQGN